MRVQLDRLAGRRVATGTGEWIKRGAAASHMSKLSKMSAIAGGLVLLVALGVLGYVAVPYVTGGMGADSRTALLQKISNQLNTGLPTQVDEGTRLDSTSVEDETLQYNFTLLGPMAERVDPQTFKNNYTPAVRHIICSKKRLRGLLKRKFTVAYRYQLEDGSALAQIRVARADCSAQPAQGAGATAQYEAAT